MMAKFHFFYGTVGAGKTTQLLQTAHNLSKAGVNILVLKPAIDMRAGSRVVSRLGLERDAVLIGGESWKDYASDPAVKHILVDEAQFLTLDEVEWLYGLCKNRNKPVFCYGLRTDYRGRLFEGSQRLLAISDELHEMPSTCACCGRSAKFSMAVGPDGGFINPPEGDPGIDTLDGEEKYKPVCGKCRHAVMESIIKNLLLQRQA
jgi:thymidine kinase